MNVTWQKHARISVVLEQSPSPLTAQSENSTRPTGGLTNPNPISQGSFLLNKRPQISKWKIVSEKKDTSLEDISTMK